MTHVGVAPPASVAAVLTVFNQHESAARIISGLLKQTTPLHRICVVVNGADGCAVESLRAQFSAYSQVEIIGSIENVGNAGGIRLAMEAGLRAGADWLWVLEDDAWPRPDALEGLLAAGEGGRLRSDAVYSSLVVDPETRALAFPCAVLDGGGRQKIARTLVELPAADFFPVRGAWLGALVSRQVVAEVGPVMSELFIRGEDEEYPARIRRAGHPFFCVKNSVVEHRSIHSLGVRLFGVNFFYEPNLALWKAYCLVRNHVYVRSRYASNRLLGLAKAVGTTVLAVGFALWTDNEKGRRCALYLRAGWHGLVGKFDAAPAASSSSAGSSGGRPRKVAIVRAMRGEFPSMDVYADGLCAGLRAAQPDWEIAELEPTVLYNQHITSVPQRVIVGLRRYFDRFVRYPLRAAFSRAEVVHILSDHHFHIAYLLRLTRKCVVATCHDLILYKTPDNIRPFARFLAISRLAQRFSISGLRACHRIITDCGAVIGEIEEILGISPARMKAVHLGIEPGLSPLTADEKTVARQKFGVPAEAFCLLHVGTVEPRKNVETILAVFRELVAVGLPVFFLKAGKPFTAAHETFIRAHGLASHCRAIGGFAAADKKWLYGAADVLVFPSLYEGFGFPIVEAMACGVPVITSNLSSMPEVASGAALLIDPRDAEAVAKAVERVYRDAGCRRDLVARGLERVRSLQWEEVAQQVAAVYRWDGWREGRGATST